MAGPTLRDRIGVEEAHLVERLRDGDERAFEDAVTRFYPSMIAVALGYIRSRALAEEVVQESWIGVLRGVGRFEGRSSFRAWVLGIVANVARTHAVREARTVPFSSFETEEGEPAVEPERFRGADDPFPGHWKSYPTDWQTLPEQQLLSRETLDLVQQTIDELPPAQRAVITLRDVTGCTAEEVCDALGISGGNQRVLLHRARARVRAQLEGHLGG